MSLPLLVIGGFNYYIDPLWNFDHANRFNSIQIAFDERQQKTNRLNYSRTDFDTLLLGSSRTIYMNPNDLPGHRTYNYSLSIMQMEEYFDYAEYAKSKNGHEFDWIIIGLDFFVTNQNLKLQSEFQPPSYYINQSNSFGYRYKTLLSLDVLELSKKNYSASKIGNPINFAYDRQGLKTLLRDSVSARDARVEANVANYRNNIYANYQYRDVKAILAAFREANPNTRFIVFTTPTAWPLWDAMVEAGLLPYYERWLLDCVEVFGQIYHFNYPNTITENLDNYYDASHLYPEGETLIAHRIVDFPDNNIPADFGMLLDQSNIQAYLAQIRSKARLH